MKSNLLKLGVGVVSLGLLSMLNAAPNDADQRINELKAAKKAEKAAKRAKKEMPDTIPSEVDVEDKKSWGVKSGFFGSFGIGAGMMLFSTDNMNNNSTGGSGSGNFLNNDGYATAKDSLLAFDYTVKVGYQHYFSPYVGMRAYLSYTGGSAWPNGGGDSSLYYMNNSIEVNLDGLLEVAQTRRMSFGLIGGVSIGYANFYRSQGNDNAYKTWGSTGMNDQYFVEGSLDTGDSGYMMNYPAGSDSVGGVMIGINLGVGYTLLKHHRFEVIAKMPLLSISDTEGVYRGNMYLSNGGGTTKEIAYRYTSVNVSYSFIF